MSAAVIPIEEQRELVRDLAGFVHDPLGAVMYGFRWGRGDLDGCAGPWKWQRELLSAVREHLSSEETRHRVGRFAVASGHGIGKSSIVAWLIWWGLSTFEDCKVIVTANTGDQLKTKTQPEVAKWFRLALNSDWFEVNVTSIKVKEDQHEATWRSDFVTWSEDNPQAFAGAHNQRKRLIIICDEASEIARPIYEVIEGALTDANTEILWFMFSQPTLSNGYFYDACFGDQRSRWKVWQIRSADVEGTNKDEIAETIAFYGEDHSHVRVRYLGLPPHSDKGQFIDRRLIAEAQTREAIALPDDPLVAGVDLAWGGSDSNVIRFRRGRDARSIPPIKIPGELTRDPGVLTNRLAEILSRNFNGYKVAMLFIDSAGIAGPVAGRLRVLGFRNVMEVNFGADSIDPHYAYRRDELWARMKQALVDGLAIDKDRELGLDLAGPLLVADPKHRLKLEPKEAMKKRGIDSPDDGDALALTFAMELAPQPPKTEEVRYVSYGKHERGQSWMG